ncbi:lumazine synthase [Perkinsus chesapeaki]|uniref:6,7-dimethyl-8-ribityllumazine synthase n=1 Tax=Perkinsus chesapeaki TaxID=330153 RepID=A0A7J6M7W7_PERCH|nr:lumazine synthase [Perkinsus chesapeaki]
MSEPLSIRGFALPGEVDGTNLKIGIVRSSWNAKVVESLEQGALDVLVQCGVKKDDIITEYVAGAYEIPYAVQVLLEKTKVDAVIAIGCLIKGETMHFEYISEAVTHGLTRLCLDYKKPVIYGVLTVLTEEQAKARCGLLGESSHGNEARDWAKTAIRLLLFDGSCSVLGGGSNLPDLMKSRAREPTNHGAVSSLLCHLRFPTLAAERMSIGYMSVTLTSWDLFDYHPLHNRRSSVKSRSSQSVIQLEQSLRGFRTPSSFWTSSTGERDSWVVYTMDSSKEVLVRRSGEDLKTSSIRGPGVYYDPLRERELNSSCGQSHNFRGKCEEAKALWHRSAYSHKYRIPPPLTHSVLSFTGGWSNPPPRTSFHRGSFTDYSWRSILEDGDVEEPYWPPEFSPEEVERGSLTSKERSARLDEGLEGGNDVLVDGLAEGHSPFDVLLSGSTTNVADALRDLDHVTPPGSSHGRRPSKAPRRPILAVTEQKREASCSRSPQTMSDCAEVARNYDLSYGQVASTIRRVVPPKRYRPLQPGEALSFSGAGILPVAIRPTDGDVVVLLHRAKIAGSGAELLYDFGGFKLTPEERPSATASRHFGDLTYGLFSFQPDHSSGLGAGVAYDDALLDTLFAPPGDPTARRALPSAVAQSWAQERLLKLSGTPAPDEILRCTHVNNRALDDVSDGSYICYLLPVQYIDDGTLNYASELCDGGSRQFQWVPAQSISCFPIAPRISMHSLRMHLEALTPTDLEKALTLQEIDPQNVFPCHFNVSGDRLN